MRKKRRTNELITGVEYWRCKRQVRKGEIRALLGGSFQNWTRPDTLPELSNARNLLQVSDRLDVTVDQLFETHSVAELSDGDRPQRISKYADPGNYLSNYRIRNGLNFQQLADRLGGVSRQCAQEMCQSSRTSKAGIRRICAYEKTTEEAFCKEYSAG